VGGGILVLRHQLNVPRRKGLKRMAFRAMIACYSQALPIGPWCNRGDVLTLLGGAGALASSYLQDCCTLGELSNLVQRRKLGAMTAPKRAVPRTWLFGVTLQEWSAPTFMRLTVLAISLPEKMLPGQHVWPGELRS
jgi:hypothetical protein